MNTFDGKVCVVTGGASGIGRALALMLGVQGARVVVADIHGEGAQTTAIAIRDGGGDAQAVRTDITQQIDVDTLYETAVGLYGRVDYAFHIAGIGLLGEARDLSISHWEKIIDVNLIGTVRCTDAAYRIMLRQGSGHIVNMASLAGLVGYPTMTPYAATKSAVVGMSLSLRTEAEALGVKVTALCPGFIHSSIYSNSPSIKVDAEAVWKELPFPIMDTDKAAALILRGVERNRAVVVFPGYGRLLWALYRLNPGITAGISRMMVATFRKYRGEKVDIHPARTLDLTPDASR